MIRAQTPRKKIEKLAAVCKKCGHCCSFDSGIFLDEDIIRVSKHKDMAQDAFKKKYLRPVRIYNREVHKAQLAKMPVGACVFLKDNKCTIQDVKPLHCRFCNPCSKHGVQLSQWFMLNYIVDEGDKYAMQEWAHYAKGKKIIGEKHGKED